MTTSAIVLIIAICEMLKSILLSLVDPPYGVNILVGVTGIGKRVISAPSEPLKLKLAGHIL